MINDYNDQILMTLITRDHWPHSPGSRHTPSRQSRRSSPPGRHRRGPWRCTGHCRTGARPGDTPARWCSGWAAPSWALGDQSQMETGWESTNLLESWSQLSTFAFQSQVCLKMSKARPAGHLTAARRMVPAAPALSHL